MTLICELFITVPSGIVILPDGDVLGIAPQAVRASSRPASTRLVIAARRDWIRLTIPTTPARIARLRLLEIRIQSHFGWVGPTEAAEAIPNTCIERRPIRQPSGAELMVKRVPCRTICLGRPRGPQRDRGHHA
ncbi:MAG: hypothetical protein NVS3B21_18550 [Acidimicrobiales bacterium]